MIRRALWSAVTRPRSSSSPKHVCQSQPSQGTPPGMTMSTSETGTANLFMIFAPLEGWRHVKCH